VRLEEEVGDLAVLVEQRCRYRKNRWFKYIIIYPSEKTKQKQTHNNTQKRNEGCLVHSNKGIGSKLALAVEFDRERTMTARAGDFERERERDDIYLMSVYCCVFRM
jgi:hypothetical protein